MKKSGFNFARDLHRVKRAIHEMPNEVLSNLTPLAVITTRNNTQIKNKVKEGSCRCKRWIINRDVKKGRGGVSINRVSENVPLRYQPQ